MIAISKWNKLSISLAKLELIRKHGLRELKRPRKLFVRVRRSQKQKCRKISLHKQLINLKNKNKWLNKQLKKK